MKRITLPAILLFAAAFAPAQDISGEWHGFVEVTNDAPLRLALHITSRSTASVDSADEGVADLPVDSLQVSDGLLKFSIPSIAGAYQGRISADGSLITGSWTQDGGVWNLVWERGEDPANISRPLDAAQAKQNGQTCARWFEQGEPGKLWSKFSPVLQQAWQQESKLAEFREQTVQRLGPETQLLEETVQPDGLLQVYRRIARFQKSPDPVEVRFAFDPVERAVFFSIGAASLARSR